MNGDEILQQVVDEQLLQLDLLQGEMVTHAASAIVPFCLGAADALTKAGLLSASFPPRQLDRLYRELEAHGLGQRVAVRVEAQQEVVAYPRGFKTPEEAALASLPPRARAHLLRVEPIDDSHVDVLVATDEMRVHCERHEELWYALGDNTD
jgi:hypothetical protein